MIFFIEIYLYAKNLSPLYLYYFYHFIHNRFKKFMNHECLQDINSLFFQYVFYVIKL